MLDEENYNFKTKKKIVPQNTKNKKKKNIQLYKPPQLDIPDRRSHTNATQLKISFSPSF